MHDPTVCLESDNYTVRIISISTYILMREERAFLAI